MSQEHSNAIYSQKGERDVSWFEQLPGFQLLSREKTTIWAVEVYRRRAE